MSDKAKKLLQGIVTGLLLVLLIASLTVAFLQNRSGTDYFSGAPLSLLQVTGGSMEPGFHSGDAILVATSPFSDLEPGDIIVFCRNGELITHEVIQKSGDTVITQGTANPLPDDPVSQEEYRAKVVCRIPGLGAVWQMYQNPFLFFLWTGLLALLLFGTDIFPAIYVRMTKKGKSGK